MKKINSILILLVFLSWPSFAKEKIYEYQQFLTDNNLSALIKSEEETSIDLIEFSSFSCSHCAAFHNETLQEFKENEVFKYINYYIIDYPLNQAAFYASIVANCDPSIRSMYSDTTYSNYDIWTKAGSGEQIIEMLNSYGLQFGLADEQLNTCLKDENYQNNLLELQISAQEIFGVESTPTFLINGQKVAGNRPASEFIKIIKEKLNQ